MSRPLRMGIVGGGFGAYGLAAACRIGGAFEAAALAARDPGRARAAAEKYGIGRAFDDPFALVAASDLDAVAIALPPDAQVPVALAALAAGKPVLLEKPLAPDLAGAERIVAAARDMPAMVDFIFPEVDAWRAASSLLDRRAIGALRHVAVDWRTESHDVRNRLSGWKTDPKRGGGALAHMASHALHYLERHCGRARRLSARLAGAADLPGAQTAATLALEFESGVSASVFVTIAAPFETHHSVAFHGAEGTIRLEQRGADPVAFALHAGDRRTNALMPVPFARDSSPAGTDPRAVPVARLLARFAAWIRSGVPSGPDLAAGLRVQTLIDAAHRSHDDGVCAMV